MTSTIIEKFRKDYTPYPFILKQVRLSFDFDDQHCIVSSELELQRKKDLPAGEGKDLVLHGEELKLLELKLDGVILTHGSFRIINDLLTVADVPNQFTLSVKTEIYPDKNTSLSGLYQSNHKYCTQCEAEGFRRITFFPDRPDVLTRYEVSIEADQKAYPYLLSNGELQSTETLANGRHRAVWMDPHPKPSYLFALVAGNFDLLEDDFTCRSGRKVLLQIYVDKGKLNQCHFAMESLKKSMRWDEQTYGLEYDLNRYMIVAVGDFNMGAMENKGLNVFNTAYVLADERTATDSDFEGVEAVIGHEYFHNWTGNRVTCQDWFQLSLKEGLTVFREQQFSGDMNSSAIQRIDDVKTLRAFQFPEDAGPMAHPIRPDSYIEMNNFYTSTVYIKGAEVIRMMETILGRRTFNQGVRHYLSKHDGQAVTCEDFVVAMEEVSGHDLGQFRYWYSQSGTPHLEVNGQWQESNQQFIIEIRQTCPPTPGQSLKEPFYIPLRVALIDTHGELMPVEVNKSETDVRFDVIKQGQELVVFLSRGLHRLTLQNVESEPTPSLLRGFSAPVTLFYPYSRSEQLHLIAHDTDPYVRWQANQELTRSVIDHCLKKHAHGETIEISDIDPLVLSRKAVIDDAQIDPAFKALQLELPAFHFIMETFNPVPIAALIDIWPVVRRLVAESLLEKLQSVSAYCLEQLEQTSASRQEAAKWRRLLNTSMALMAPTGAQEVLNLAKQLYAEQPSMTIKQQMLTLIHHDYTDVSADLLEDFYQRWQDEELVLDKWFTIQSTLATEQVHENIRDLLQHADFSLTNPNKVRSVIGRFAQINPAQFHDHEGRGYELVATHVLKLNKINPQIAARLCGAFNGWKHLDCSHRQALIKEQLKRILNTEDLSADVFEIANKALLVARETD